MPAAFKCRNALITAKKMSQVMLDRGDNFQVWRFALGFGHKQDICSQIKLLT